jgi:predicted transposase YdaD
MSNSTDKPYDQAFKYLAEKDAESLLFLLGALPENLTSIEVLPPELSFPAVLPDQLYRVTTSEETYLIHIEAQTYWDAAIPQRMPEYAVLAWLKYRLPVFSYVLVLSKKRFPLNLPLMGIINAGRTQVVTHYPVIRLWEISAIEAMARRSETILPFVPLMQGGEEALLESAERLCDVQDETKRREMALHFLVLGGLRYNHVDLLELVGGTKMISLHDLRDSSIYQMILLEGQTKGLQQGTAAAEHALRRLATNRFPGIELATELSEIHDLEKMSSLVEEILQFDSAAALNSRIKEIAARKN